MHLLAATAEAIGGTSKKSEKVAILAEYLRARSVDEAAASALFLSGRAFPGYSEKTLQVGGSLLWRVVTELSGKSETAVTAAYRKHGDLGSAAYDLLRSSAPATSNLNVLEVAEAFERIASVQGTSARYQLVRELLVRSTALEAKYIVKIMTGDLRIGLKESLVEEAIARAWEAPVTEVQRANMMLGDIAATLRLASAHQLREARMRLLHPIGFMLASPVDSTAEAFDVFQHAQVEDKYDGIRAQAHCAGEGAERKVRLFSRTLDEVTESFPELVAPLRAFRGDLVLDGEIVAWQAGSVTEPARALPFSQLQKRLGRKKVTPTIMREVPIAYVVFDVLYAEGELIIDRSLQQRGAMLDEVFSTSRDPIVTPAENAQGELAFEAAIAAQEESPTALPDVIRAPVLRADSAKHLEQIFEAALARGNEGLMIKDIGSPYTPGRRGKTWLKLKRELATLDVVVTAVEYGHGKRARVLSDYTFAVRDGEELRNVGKAYSGLTDAEIAELTQWFLAHTIADQGFRRVVEPKIVLEVAFNAVMRSDRHDSGYALRFPRIVRVRSDKTPDQIDTLEAARNIYERQKWPETAA